MGTMDILHKHGFRFKKKWGQNFLFDKNILGKMVETAGVAKGDRVVEIGPGAGSLTQLLAEKEARVMAVEIDPALIPVLRETLAGQDVTLVQGDILKMDLDKVTAGHHMEWPYKVVANLPYYITTPVLLYLLENSFHIESITVMVQWEVAKRLTAGPGTKDYGAVTLAVDYYTEAGLMFKVPRNLFRPAPEVDSAVIHLRRRKAPPVDVRDEAFMFRLIKAAFGQRRKTLLNALGSLGEGAERATIAAALAKAGLDGQRRGETLSLKEFACLANAWQETSTSNKN